MTRDDAIAKVLQRSYEPGETLKGHEVERAIVVDCLVALGLLKLDEPKTAEEDFRHRLRLRWNMDSLLADIKHFGFKIVRADNGDAV